MKRADNQPVGGLTVYAGIFCKVWTVPDRGTMVPQHAHEHPHLTLVVRGVVRVWRGDDLDGDYQAPAMLKIPAHTFHKFLSLSDDCAFACIHSVGEADAVVVAENHVLELED